MRSQVTYEFLSTGEMLGPECIMMETLLLSQDGGSCKKPDWLLREINFLHNLYQWLLLNLYLIIYLKDKMKTGCSMKLDWFKSLQPKTNHTHAHTYRHTQTRKKKKKSKIKNKWGSKSPVQYIFTVTMVTTVFFFFKFFFFF